MALLKLNTPAIELNLQQFEDFIKLRGVNVTWEKAAMCPCVRADTTSGRPSFNCGECYNGNLYVDKQEIIAAITNITGQRNAQVFGDLAMGGLYLTTSGLNRLGVNDRIIMLNQTARYAEMCELPTSKTKAPASPGATSLLLEHTRKFAAPTQVHGMIRVAGQDVRYFSKTVNTLLSIPAAGYQAITAPIPSNTVVQSLDYTLRYAPTHVYDCRANTDTGEQVELVQGVDYELVDGRRVRFIGSFVPSRFTILYESRPVYLVDQLSHEYRDQQLTLGIDQATLGRFPVAAVLRKDFINRVG